MNTQSTSPAAPRPSWLLLGSEPVRAATEYLSHRLRRTLTKAQKPPEGDGHPVIVFPGLATDGISVNPLVEHCRALGHVAMDWGRGFNTGPGLDLDSWLEDLAEELRQTLREKLRNSSGNSLRDSLPDTLRDTQLSAGPGNRASAAPTLIGWSLGGLYARELAKLPGMQVRQVITIGTPFNGSHEQTHAGWLYERLNGSRAQASPAFQQRLRCPPPVPTTSIYSRSDGIVAWQACRHEIQGALVQDIEVRGSHLGLGWNPAVLRLVADRLAQPAHGWQRHGSSVEVPVPR